jgi:23S rRNA pseudouridine2605 synthase
MVFEGRVKVNGNVIRRIVLIDPEYDIVEVDGKIVTAEEKKVYIMLNKPVGVITSANDQFGRKTVLDLIDIEERVFPIGRLDYDTSGLLLLTNDGEIANKVMHPSNEIEKVYIAEVEGVPTIDEMNRFMNGLKIEDYITAPAKIKVLKNMGNRSVVEITIYEGRNRQVRKMCESIGHKVRKLNRIRIGKISLGKLNQGQWRYLTAEEIDYLKSL